jgi:tight adherence protein B
MSELWVITLLIFAAALFGVVAAYSFAFEAGHARKSISRRIALSRQLRNPTEILDTLRRERGIIDSHIPALSGVNAFLVQTGIRLDRNLLVLCAIALSVVIFLLTAVLLGHGGRSAAIGISAALALITLYLRTARHRRIARFAQQFPDAIDVMVRGLRVGYPLPSALDLVAREMPDPIGTEFGMTADEIAFGQDINAAMENLYRRVGQEDLQFLIVSVNVQTQTGGNLAEVLTRLSRLLRSRAKVTLRIRALSAEGRMSARFLSLMPFFLVGIISLVSPSFFSEVRQSSVIEPALIYAAVSLLVGNIVMYRMVNFKF